MHKTALKLLPSLGFAAVLVLGGCSTTSDPSTDWAMVIEKEWQLDRIMTGGTERFVEPPVMASALFSTAGTVSGSAGCNRYAGEYSQTDMTLEFMPVAMTKRLCVGDAMLIEDAFSAALGQVTNWKLVDGKLVLADNAEETIMEFSNPAP